jgi:signal transduction histidine kinase
VLLIRRWRVRAAQLATAGLLCLGIAGLVIAAAWHIGSVTFVPSNASGKSVYAQPTSASAKAAYAQPAPAKSAYVQPAPAAPAAVSKPPAPAADVVDIAYGQALPFGAVLVSGQHSADAAAVEGLAFLALGAWLAPQTFPRVRRMLGGASETELSKRVERLTHSRAVAVDTASADLRRLERDLHDGAQARLVALGMSLRAAERLIPTSPEAAMALVAEARETSVKALTELRELVRGVLPPVLADRGLADAVRALALDCPLRVETVIDLPGRLPAPVETACYFAVAEVLTNAAKHSGARDARICMSHSAGMLRIEVTDFGLGGADPASGSGLAGVEKRLATFDGILAISSPPGGPTMVVMEVPCALSSLKISSC